MGLQYRMKLVGAAFIGIVAAYTVISSYTNRTSEPTQPNGTNKNEITIGDGPSQDEITTNVKPYTGPTTDPHATLPSSSGIFQITKGTERAYPISFDPPLSINGECIDKDVHDLQEKIGIDNAIIYAVRSDDKLYGFNVFPEENGEEIEDDLAKIIENCQR